MSNSSIDHILDGAQDRDETILAIVRGLWDVATSQRYEIEQLKERVSILEMERKGE